MQSWAFWILILCFFRILAMSREYEEKSILLSTIFTKFQNEAWSQKYIILVSVERIINGQILNIEPIIKPYTRKNLETTCRKHRRKTIPSSFFMFEQFSVNYHKNCRSRKLWQDNLDNLVPFKYTHSYKPKLSLGFY